MQIIYYLLMLAVIGGHLLFAYLQFNKWPGLCKSLLGLTDRDAVQKTETLGRSFATYNASIAVGLALSFLMEQTAMFQVQIAVLGFIVFTAVFGWLGTRKNSNSIFIFRLLPAVLALIATIIVRP